MINTKKKVSSLLLHSWPQDLSTCSCSVKEISFSFCHPHPTQTPSPPQYFLYLVQLWFAFYLHESAFIKAGKVIIIHLRIFLVQCMPSLLLLLSRFSHVRLSATPQTAAHQVPLSLGFSRQEHWSGLSFPSSRHESEK